MGYTAKVLIHHYEFIPYEDILDIEISGSLWERRPASHWPHQRTKKLLLLLVSLSTVRRPRQTAELRAQVRVT